MRYPQEVALKEGTEAVLRPLEKADAPELRQFYTEIPELEAAGNIFVNLTK